MASGSTDPAGICEHGEIRAACIECLGRPQPLAPRAAAAPRKATATPKSADDEILPLHGTKDVSVPVYSVDTYVERRTDWLIANGYPHDLRPGGWIYLRVNRVIEARVRAKRMEWWEDRRWRTDVEEDDRAGPGMVFRVDPETWERIAIDLGDLADSQRQGYRYLLTYRGEAGEGGAGEPDGEGAAAVQVKHLAAGDPVPAGEWDD